LIKTNDPWILRSSESSQRRADIFARGADDELGLGVTRVSGVSVRFEAAVAADLMAFMDK
jgi:hypothetical protein